MIKSFETDMLLLGAAAVLMAATTAIMAGTLLGVGLWGFIKKRPMLFPARVLFWPALLFCLPLTLVVLRFAWDARGLLQVFGLVWAGLQISVFGLLVVIYRRQMTGYLVFGISDDTFRPALVYALRQLQWPYQETVAKFRLTELEADVQAVVAEWMGSAQIRIKQPQHAARTKTIAAAMDAFYQVTPVKLNTFSFTLYVILGVAMLALAMGLIGFQVVAFDMFSTRWP